MAVNMISECCFDDRFVERVVKQWGFDVVQRYFRVLRDVTGMFR